jgi:hypothetical protein
MMPPELHVGDRDALTTLAAVEPLSIKPGQQVQVKRHRKGTQLEVFKT